MIFLFEWCDCIYESAYYIKSIHSTKSGAVKAMIKECNERWYRNRNYQLIFGGVGKHRYDPLQYEAWRIRPMKLED